MLDTDSIVNILSSSGELRETIPSLMSINRYYLELFHNQDFLDKIATSLHLPKFPDIQSLISYSEEPVNERLLDAVRAGNLSLVRLLIEKDDASNISDALMKAAKKGHIDIAKYLLGTDYINYSRILHACDRATRKKSLKMVKLILSYVKVEDYHHCLSFKAGSESIIRFFMQFRLDAPKLYKRAIRTAATSGFLGIIDTIPDDISSDGITGLLTPLIEEGRADILYYLIKKDIKIGMRHVGNYMGNSLGVFKYLIKDITYPLQELMYEYAVDLSRNPNERIFDLVYEIASKYKKDVPQMIVGAIKSRNAKNFWKIFLNTDWGPDYHVLNKLIEENGVRLPDTSDEIFYAVLPYIKSLSDLAARCVMSDRIDLFEAVHSIIRERGQASEGFYTRILSTAIVRSNVKLARRLIELGAHISTSFSDSITSMEMLLFLETKTVITRNAYKRLLYNALSHGLIVLAKHCYEKVGFLITGKTMKGWIRNIQVTMATSRFLLDRGADPNILFKAAVRSRDLRSVKLAFERGATNIASVMNNAKRRYTSDYLDKVKELLTK